LEVVLWPERAELIKRIAAVARNVLAITPNYIQALAVQTTFIYAAGAIL
jgi:hypothetical protein